MLTFGVFCDVEDLGSILDSEMKTVGYKLLVLAPILGAAAWVVMEGADILQDSAQTRLLPDDRHPTVESMPTSLLNPPLIGLERMYQPMLPFVEYPFPFLDDEPDDVSVSVGTVTEGFVVNTSELYLPSMHYDILPRQLLRNLRYGTDEMVALISHGAREVANEYPGSVLWLGNLGGRGGHDIPYSVSHNSGRDADLAFYFVDEHGQNMMPPDLLEVGHDLTALHGETIEEQVVYYFDVERNWALIRALLEAPDVQIQFLFIANHLKDTLLAHAAAIGESASLITQANTVMTQPGRDIPHDDHIHLRIYCSEADVGGGCVNSGRVHPWVDTFSSARGDRADEVREYLGHEEGEQRARAIERLVLLGFSSDLERYLSHLTDSSSRVRSAAAVAIAQTGTRRHVDELIEAWEVETDGQVLVALTEAIGEFGGEEATAFLMSLLSVPHLIILRGYEVDARTFAIDELAQLEFADAVPELISLLDSHDAYLRARIVWALGRLTNQTIDFDWADSRLDSMTLGRGQDSWSDWYDANGTFPRESWLIDGFASLGFQVVGDALDLNQLVQAVAADRSYVSYNAQRALMNLLGRESASLTWTTNDAAWYWSNIVGP